MELDLLWHNLINSIGSYIIHIASILLILKIVMAIFGISLPIMSWLKKCYDVVAAFLKWCVVKLIFVLKISFKWGIYSIGKLVMFVLDITRKLIEFCRYPNA